VGRVRVRWCVRRQAVGCEVAGVVWGRDGLNGRTLLIHVCSGTPRNQK